MLVALAAAGCGDTGPSSAQFAREADRVCAKTASRLARIRGRLETARGIEDPARGFAALAAATRDETAVRRPLLDRLDALERPGEEADAIAGWVAGLRARETARERLAVAYAAEDRTGVARGSARVDRLDRSALVFARGFGLRACA